MPPRRRRRQRTKPKARNVINSDTFMDNLEAAFDFDGPEEIFDEIREDQDTTQNISKYYAHFLERTIAGNCGLIMQLKDRTADPDEYSVLGCRSEEGTCNWLSQLEIFTREHPILKNKMDEIISLMLTHLGQVKEELHPRIFRLIAQLHKFKLYKKSSAQEYYLLEALKSLPNSDLITAKILCAFQEIQFDLPRIFDQLVQQNVVEHVMNNMQIPDEFWAEHCPWFLEMLNVYRANIEKNENKYQLIGFLEDEKLEEAIEHFRRSVEQFGYDEVQASVYCFQICLQLININSRNNVQNEIHNLFISYVPFIKALIKPTVPNQAMMLEELQKCCFNRPELSEGFKTMLMILYKEQLVDGRVILAWFDRATGFGKAAFSCQIARFVDWLREKK